MRRDVLQPSTRAELFRQGKTLEYHNLGSKNEMRVLFSLGTESSYRGMMSFLLSFRFGRSC